MNKQTKRSKKGVVGAVVLAGLGLTLATTAQADKKIYPGVSCVPIDSAGNSTGTPHYSHGTISDFDLFLPLGGGSPSLAVNCPITHDDFFNPAVKAGTTQTVGMASAVVTAQSSPGAGGAPSAVSCSLWGETFSGTGLAAGFSSAAQSTSSTTWQDLTFSKTVSTTLPDAWSWYFNCNIPARDQNGQGARIGKYMADEAGANL